MMKENRIKRIVASSLVIGMVFTVNPVFAAGRVIPTTKIDMTVKEEVKTVEKKTLDYDMAIKRAVEYSLTRKSAELQEETLQDKIDDNFNSYDKLFSIKDPNILAGTIANMDVYNKNLTTGRDFMVRQKTVDTENLKITVAGLFNNIEQKLKSIEYLNKKIAQGEVNLDLYKKQLGIGMISENEMKQQEIANKALKTELALEEVKLREHYAELEKTTGLSNIEESYNLAPLDMEYKEISMSKNDLEIYKRNIENFDLGILAKKNAVENKTTAYDNYAEIYNFQHLSYLAGNQPSEPSFDYKSTRDEKNVAELDLSQTIQNAKMNVEKNYSNLQQLQNNIASMKVELDKLDVQMEALDKKYELGLVSKNVYDNTKLSREELKNKLDGMIVQQKQLKLLFESPYFAGMSMGA
ncbi:MAG: hypothetical protein ACRC76_05565 [Proteocatella sp.]